MLLELAAPAPVEPTKTITTADATATSAASAPLSTLIHPPLCSARDIYKCYLARRAECSARLRRCTQVFRGVFARLAVVRLRHRPVVEGLVEHVLGDPALACDLAERAAGRGRLLDDLRTCVVADVRVQRGGGGERELGIALALLAV